MREFFRPVENGKPFILFSTDHILFIFSVIIIIFLIYIFRDKMKKNKIFYERLLIYSLIISEGSLHVWRIYVGKWTLTTSLPFHLCGISIILAIIMLINKNFYLFELTYFWGLIGAFIAIITPSLDVNYTHYRFWQFLIAHASVVFAVVYMLFVENYRVNYKSVWKTFGITNFIVLIVGVINIILDSNYLFLCGKPMGTSKTLFDFFGPWPWYLVTIEFLAITVFHIWYIPFWLKNKIHFINSNEKIKENMKGVNFGERD